MKRVTGRLVVAVAAAAIVAVSGCSANTSGNTSANTSSGASAVTSSGASGSASSVAATEAPARPETAGGVVYATDIVLAADGRLEYDQVSWFWGAAAVSACARDHVDAKGAWCTQYYWTNDRHTRYPIGLTTGVDYEVTAAHAAAAGVKDPGMKTPVRVSRATLTRVLAADKGLFWELTPRGGKITRIREVSSS